MNKSYILSVKLKLTDTYYCRLPNPHFLPRGALPFLTAGALGQEMAGSEHRRVVIWEREWETIELVRKICQNLSTFSCLYFGTVFIAQKITSYLKKKKKKKEG